MAHRKLFSSSPEGSIDCTIYFCDWSCPNYPCVLFPPINYSAFISPPPPPQPSRHQSVSPFIIALISILSIVFVMAFCCALFRNDPNSNNLSNETDNHNPRLHRQLGEEHRLNQNLSPRGMEPVLIKSIKAYKYKKSDGSINGMDCSVCLCEFEEDETLRRLPKCSHYFHTNCIDTWLSSHANCPLCRASILSISSPSTDSVDQNVGNLSGNEEIQIRIGEVSNDEWRENRGET